MVYNKQREPYANRLELALMGHYQKCIYELKYSHIDSVYEVESQKYICYRKILKDSQKCSLIQEHINSSTYNWSEHAFHNTISIFYFKNIRKNNEHTIFHRSPYSEDLASPYWDKWGVWKDGTIFNSKETEVMIRRLQSSEIESNHYGSYDTDEWDEQKAREYYSAYLAGGDFNV